MRMLACWLLTLFLGGDGEKVSAIHPPTGRTTAAAAAAATAYSSYPQQALLPLTAATACNNSSLLTKTDGVASVSAVTSVNSLKPVETATKLSSSSLAATATATATAHRDMMIAYLGVMSGFSGVLCFRRFGCYINMMTGNVSRLAHAVAACEWNDALFYVCLTGSYAMGTFLYRVLEIRQQGQQQQQQQQNQKEVAERQEVTSVGSSNTSLPPTIIPTFWTLFLLADLIDKATPLPTKCMIPFLAAGFAMISSYSQSCLGCITNAATGHLTRMGMGLADSLLLQAPFWAKRRTSGGFFLGFALSALITSILHRQWSNTTKIFQGLPMGMSFALLYTLLLSWYNGPVAVPSSSSSSMRGIKFRLQVFFYSLMQRR